MSEIFKGVGTMPYLKVFCYHNRCRNCGECIDFCPTNSLNETDGKIQWVEESCKKCESCEDVCDFKALHCRWYYGDR